MTIIARKKAAAGRQAGTEAVAERLHLSHNSEAQREGWGWCWGDWACVGF